MKTNFRKRIAWSILLMGSLGVTSCIDNSINLDNLSNDIWLGGDIEMPVLATSTFRMDSLLNRINQPESQARIGINPDNDIVTLYYDGGIEDYDMSEINYNFGAFALKMNNLSISEIFAENAVVSWLLDTFGSVKIPSGSPQNYPVNISVANSVNIADTVQIDHVDFKSVDINFTLTTNIQVETDGVLSVTLEVPQLDAEGNPTSPFVLTKDLPKGTGAITISFPNQSVVMDCTKDILLNLKINGDNKTEISSASTVQAEISFVPNGYVVWGWFNFSYTFDAPVKTAAVTAEVDKYISEESKLIFANPLILLNANSSVGAELAFDLISLTTFYRDGDSLKIDRSKANQQPITLQTVNRAETPGTYESTQAFLSRTINALTDDEKNMFANMFSTHLDSMSVTYKVKTALNSLQNLDGIPMQFIASDSRVNVKTDAELPFTLQTGSQIYYTETVKTDFGDDLKSEDVNATVILYLVYSNTLPVDVNVKVYRLDESERKIDAEPWVFGMKAGKENEPLELAPIKLQDYLDAKYLKFEYDSNTLTSEESIHGKDYFKIQVGTKLNGHININGGDKK